MDTRIYYILQRNTHLPSTVWLTGCGQRRARACKSESGATPAVTKDLVRIDRRFAEQRYFHLWGFDVMLDHFTKIRALAEQRLVRLKA